MNLKKNLEGLFFMTFSKITVFRGVIKMVWAKSPPLHYHRYPTAIHHKRPDCPRQHANQSFRAIHIPELVVSALFFHSTGCHVWSVIYIFPAPGGKNHGPVWCFFHYYCKCIGIFAAWRGSFPTGIYWRGIHGNSVYCDGL